MPFPAKTNAEAILSSATDIIRSGGLTALSMRTLAGRLNVRASSLYRHFPDRSAIEKGLASRSAEQLLEKMQQAVQGQTGERAVLSAARAYLDFATTEFAFYDMMMRSIASSLESSEPTKRIWGFFLQIMGETTSFQEDAAGAAALWAFLHGFTTLLRSGQVAEPLVKVSFTRGAQALIRGLSVADAEAARSMA